MLQFEELNLELSSYEDKLKDLAEALGLKAMAEEVKDFPSRVDVDADDFFAPLCVCLFALSQITPVFICEVHSELIDVAERCIEDGVPECCDALQIRTCAFEMEHRIAVDPAADDVTLQSDHRLPWIPLPDGTLHLSSLPEPGPFECQQYAGALPSDVHGRGRLHSGSVRWCT